MKLATSLLAGTLVIASAAFSYQSRATPDGATVEATASEIVPEIAMPAAPAPVVWTRPAGPLRVALQAGHWKSAEAPDEQAGLRGNGTRGGGKAEWEVNLNIAQLTAAILEERGYLVEILPTTIPPGYWADVFVSIHADGNTNTGISGYRASGPRRDRTGRASDFADMLEETYGEATGLRHYPTVTRRMQNYYAFNWRRYQHALHPMTTGVIIETGFLTSPVDRRIIVNEPHRAAHGIADAVTLYLQTAALEPIEIMPEVVDVYRGPDVGRRNSSR